MDDNGIEAADIIICISESKAQDSIVTTKKLNPPLKRSLSDPTTAPRSADGDSSGSSTPIARSYSDPITHEEKEAIEQAHSDNNKKDKLFDFLNGSIHPIVRRLSISLVSTPIATFYCGICLENNDVTTAFKYSSCSMDHQYCKGCIGKNMKVCRLFINIYIFSRTIHRGAGSGRYHRSRMSLT